MEFIQSVAGSVAVRLKVVPGASRTQLTGVLGDRLKVQVAAPPEGGKANKAVIRLLARTLDVPARHIAVTAGQTMPLKTVTIVGVPIEHVRARLL